MPIAGILHAAMVVRDVSLSSMSFEDWQAATAPKIQGTWNLHRSLEKHSRTQFSLQEWKPPANGTFANRIQKIFFPIPCDEVPAVLFRAECRRTRSLFNGSIRARTPNHEGPPSAADFDDTLSWQTERPTRFRCFSTNWHQTLNRRAEMEQDEEEDIIVVAVWAKGLTNVYNALDAATTLGYSDTGTEPVRNIWDHHQEFLVDNGIAADEYRILAVFEGGGESRSVKFKCPLYRIVTVVPDEFFCGRRTVDALVDIEDEIKCRTGSRDDQKRDELMKAIANVSLAPSSFPTIIYQGNNPMLGELHNLQPPGNANNISFYDQLIPSGLA
ncbi:hypothetical protein BDW74DRAFT_179030 [Aspergillus multicolor]|uniref:uncharacterized protein n=1 Tax=Aspergillus multicolor TaxID=41759 RepID=UPI003CCDC807